MSTEQIIILASVLAGSAVFYLIGRHATFFSRYLVHFVVGIPLFLIVLLPSLVLVIPFIGKETEDTPVIVESVEEYRGGSTAFRPGKYGRVVEVGLAVRDVIRFPFTFGQLLVAIVPAMIFFMIFADWVHKKRLLTKKP